MRVERFSLFFPPLIARHRRGETEYAIGAIPLGGYVKITGMNPPRRSSGRCAPGVLPPAGVEADRGDRRRAGGQHRARVPDPVGADLGQRVGEPTNRIERINGHPRAASWRWATGSWRSTACAATETLQAPDRLHRCAEGGRRLRRDHAGDDHRVAARRRAHGAVAAGLRRRPRRTCWSASRSAPCRNRSGQWRRRSVRLGNVAVHHEDGRDDRGRLPGGQARRHLRRRRLLRGDAPDDRAERRTRALLAIISLSLGVINLFPFLPLDGGHIFWALAEKARGRAIRSA